MGLPGVRVLSFPRFIVRTCSVEHFLVRTLPLPERPRKTCWRNRGATYIRRALLCDDRQEHVDSGENQGVEKQQHQL